ncbi:MAG: 50S ribosomal protein L13 [Chrysiogenetes bacterium]|nr:50S ribosomal protein L13 [Chrysiogenetes bacterium]
MQTKSTPFAKTGEIERNWFHVDADGEVLGRLATRIAMVLKGKHKPQFTPHIDTGDFIVVTNVEKIKLTGNKWADKMYYRYSGYVGGLKETTAAELRERHPEDILRLAVKRMLPNTPLHRKMLTKLKIYAGTDHPHSAQKPAPLPR